MELVNVSPPDPADELAALKKENQELKDLVIALSKLVISKVMEEANAPRKH